MHRPALCLSIVVALLTGCAEPPDGVTPVTGFDAAIVDRLVAKARDLNFPVENLIRVDHSPPPCDP